MADYTQEYYPDNPSSDYTAMLPYWTMVETMLDGAEAMRKAGLKYLPKFVNETLPDYEFRRKNAVYSNIYRDIIEGLAAKPFAKEVAMVDGSSQGIKDLIEDIDGQGNSLHVFAASVFFRGINDAIDWILVDKPPVAPGSSLAAERAAGARPYWVHIPAQRVLAVYSDTINGKEEIIHARIHEPNVKRDGYTEVAVNRVREFNRLPLGDGNYGPAFYTLWEEQKKTSSVNIGPKSVEWVAIDTGLIAIGIIALVPFITGRRKENSWQFVPPMQDCAYLQIEHYQQETNLKGIREQACFPMLAGNGVQPDLDAAGVPRMVPVGPKSVLFAPPNASGVGTHGQWQFIEPAATSMKFLADDIKNTEQRMRELGRQPLTAQSGNLTVITTAFAASKGNSAVQAWALNLKDALEQALKYTCMWLADTSEPEVVVYTDFALDIESDQAALFLISLRKGGLAGPDISREAIIEEAKRRDYLSPEYDAEEDLKKILAEQPAQPSPADLLAAMGRPPPGNLPPKPPPNLRAVQ